VKPLAVFTILLVLGGPGVWAQNASPPTSGSPGTPAANPVQPYQDREFAPWVLQLRRAEILTVGTFPLAYLFSSLGYDYFYYLSNGFPQGNVPWPVGPGTSQWTVTSQKDLVQGKAVTLISVSLLCGIVLAAVDWWLGEQKP
jgi:hypothetical protein